MTMLFERIGSAGLSHYSYLIGDRGEAAVIDPRRDCGVYVSKAIKEGYRICHILETHRNEDYVAGSVELAFFTLCTSPGFVWNASPAFRVTGGFPGTSRRAEPSTMYTISLPARMGAEYE